MRVAACNRHQMHVQRHLTGAPSDRSRCAQEIVCGYVVCMPPDCVIPGVCRPFSAFVSLCPGGRQPHLRRPRQSVGERRSPVEPLHSSPRRPFVRIGAIRVCIEGDECAVQRRAAAGWTDRCSSTRRIHFSTFCPTIPVPKLAGHSGGCRKRAGEDAGEEART